MPLVQRHFGGKKEQNGLGMVEGWGKSFSLARRNHSFTLHEDGIIASSSDQPNQRLRILLKVS